MNTSTGSSPSPRQLRYLRDLANQTGTSFTNPATRAEASYEIDRLVKLKSGVSRLPLDFVDNDAEQALRYATEVGSEEVSGHGASARWANASEPSEGPSQPPVGERTELARYRISEGERILYGQRVNGRVRVTDRPAGAGGRSYLVQAGLEADGFDALHALIADYVEQAARYDRVPMATSELRQSEHLANA